MLKHFVGTAKEQFFYHNTLLCLVKALEGQNITVDLRHDSHVCGEVILVDGYMNISFGTAVFVDAKGNEFAYDNLFIQGRNIRYVHIPENMAARDTIKTELLKVAPKPRNQNEQVRKSRKAKKALKLHMETVARLQDTKDC
ncbi:U7 snRNA-associated Sm-like protein LSm10 [Cydia splendana]|uniref:U7 snRNA-associated Sm-like protein LSm10 n=1 Tax=Cydia splendana TaxID=1100963 RepID=UPI0021308958